MKRGVALAIAALAVVLTAVAVFKSSPAKATLPGYNGLIAFAGGRPTPQVPDVWTMEPDGNKLTDLTGGDTSYLAPAWSPDGSKIAYVRTTGGDHEIWVMDADGSH